MEVQVVKETEIVGVPAGHSQHEPGQAAPPVRRSWPRITPVAIAAKRSFRILGQFISPPAANTWMDAVLRAICKLHKA